MALEDDQDRSDAPGVRSASRRLIDAIGPLTEDQAARVLAIFNRHWLPQEQPAEPARPDAA